MNNTREIEITVQTERCNELADVLSTLRLTYYASDQATGTITSTFSIRATPEDLVLLKLSISDIVLTDVSLSINDAGYKARMTGEVIALRHKYVGKWLGLKL